MTIKIKVNLINGLNNLKRSNMKTAVEWLVEDLIERDLIKKMII
jgi:hypothetical protein